MDLALRAMTTNRQFGDSEGDFHDWHDYPDPCNRQLRAPDGTAIGVCGAPVKARTWESHDGAYEDYQYRCADGHVWWLDGPDA